MHGATKVAFQDLEIENTGLYVGQSRDIVVRGNEVLKNVTGIEIENSVNALVEDNYAHDNTGGILVFLLPNNPSKVGSDTRVVRNRVIANNHPNFGDPTAIVVWDGSGADNRWEQPGATRVPPLLPSKGWPAFLATAWSRVVSKLSDWLS